jgi:iron complex outermembrane receptor protein
MAIHFRSSALRRATLVACAGASSLAAAQQAAPPAAAVASGVVVADTPAVQRVDVRARAVPDDASVTGFDAPLSRTPIQASVVDAATLADLGARDLSVVTKLDASVSDAYNSAGYWTFFTVRGFVIDNRFNYRRDGLPINAETALSLANKERIEVLKGTTGLQAGTSAPGGLVDLVVKRPDADVRRFTLFAEQGGTLGTALDWSQRLGERREFGVRLNVETATLDPQVRELPGHRHSVSLAADWRPSAATSVEVEWEHSNQSERSQPGFSLLGDTLPSPHAIDPRTNLNDQPWSLPVVMQGNTGSLRLRQQLADAWTLQLHAGTQRLVSNDRVAFPYGYYYDPVNYLCDPCDRYTSDGRFSIWDFRSENERRRTDALDLSLEGRIDTLGVTHALTAGALAYRFLGRFNDEAYNLVGTGTIDGLTIVPADPTLTTPNTDRTERTTELYLRDHATFGDWGAWAGLRHTRVHRQSWQTALGDPAAATDYTQAFTTPWLALTRALTPADLLYASWGEGLQSDVTPTVGNYRDPGQPLPSQVTRQWEAGLKHAEGSTLLGIDWFDMRQAQFTDLDVGTPAAPSLVRVADGLVHVRGLELSAEARAGAFTLRGSALWQRARREGAALVASNGLRPTNVPERALKALVGYDVAALPGLRLTATVDHQGDRAVLPDDSVNIPSWTTFDLGGRYTQALGKSTLVWRAGVDNATDRRAWREAPYQYGHAYLFPLAPRTWRLSLEALL